jgi:SAM-dependent methyltransferase
MADVRETWEREGLFDRVGAGAYDFVVQREQLSKPLGRLIWGADMGRFYAALDQVGEMPAGAAILDVPCGGGVAFRALRPDQPVRYVAADLSPGMLKRARELAARSGLEARIEFVRTDVERLPFEAASFDLCLCLNSLHCFRDPAAALAEVGRVLKPGARLLCDCAVRGEGRRFDRLFDLYARRGIFGPGGTAADLRRWLEAAGLDAEVELSGAIAFVEGRRRAGART